MISDCKFYPSCDFDASFQYAPGFFDVLKTELLRPHPKSTFGGGVHAVVQRVGHSIFPWNHAFDESFDARPASVYRRGDLFLRRILSDVSS